MPYVIGRQAHRNRLLSEVTNDPRAVGFDADGNTEALLDLLNDPDKNPSPDTVKIPLDKFAIKDAVDEIRNNEYIQLSEIKKARVNAVISAAYSSSAFNLELTMTEPYRKAIRGTFGQDSETWQRIQADRVRDLSIAEELFGVDFVLTRKQWFDARDKGVVE